LVKIVFDRLIIPFWSLWWLYLQ